jgi:hypothetical protein
MTKKTTHREVNLDEVEPFIPESKKNAEEEKKPCLPLERLILSCVALVTNFFRGNETNR